FELNIINKDSIALQQTVHAQKDSQKNKLDTGFISVNIKKLDMLMDITSEIIITEALLLENPDLAGKRLTNFRSVARRFMKMTDELQDIVFSLRMLPIAPVFHKMKRIVRDMGVKLNKPVEIIFEGEETEVDKNIIEHISDPLMHIIRNSIDHGIEFPDERAAKGKPETGRIVLGAKNVGNEVWITISDDGRGLDREKILEKARQIGFTNKSSSEIDDKEVYSFIFLPGFSTKDEATEFSGRGVGMDVVHKNLEMVNGTVNIDKTSPQGTVITLRIPVTLTIIDGMNVAVGDAKYTIPVDAMQEAVVLKSKNIFVDTSGNEIANIRGNFYPLVRLNERFSVKNSAVAGVEDGICIVLDRKDQKLCLFADKLLGEQQVVFKPLPEYVKKHNGIAGCTLLGDGSISLILDTVSI
ncbi:MAG TPA: chemotaxis protein CheA, partial [Clostridia bacterium]